MSQQKSYLFGKSFPEVPRYVIPPEFRYNMPLRTQSVSLVERPRSKYARNVRSADQPSKSPYSNKLYFHQNPPPLPEKLKPKSVKVKQRRQKTTQKEPIPVSVQNISLPMKFADKPGHSSVSKPLHNNIDTRTQTNPTNPFKQVTGKRTKTQVKETENKLLQQISEAEQVADFERILNTNSILSQRSRRRLWRKVSGDWSVGAVRPRSAFSVNAVTDAYYYLFKRHEEALEPLIEQHRKKDHHTPPCSPPSSILSNGWEQEVRNLAHFYDDDDEIQQEVEAITERLITEEIQKEPSRPSRNFNVNLAGLIGLHVQGENCSPVHARSDSITPEIERSEEEDKEWLASSMSSDDKSAPQDQRCVDNIAQRLKNASLEGDGDVPTITFSNCCDNRVKGEPPSNQDVVIHLAVPAIESGVEARPPM